MGQLGFQEAYIGLGFVVTKSEPMASRNESVYNSFVNLEGFACANLGARPGPWETNKNKKPKNNIAHSLVKHRFTSKQCWGYFVVVLTTGLTP